MAVSIPENKKLIPADDKCFQYMGRIDFDDPKRPVLVWPATCVDTIFTGTSLAVVLNNMNFQELTHFAVIIDGVMQKIFFDSEKNKSDSVYTVAEGLENKPHTLRILKTLAAHNYITFCGIIIDEGAKVKNPEHKYDCRLEVYGDSVSAGEVTEALYYEGQRDPADHQNRYDNSNFSYPMALARKLNAELHDIAQGGIAVLDGTGFFCADNLKGMVSCYDKIQYSPYSETKEWDFSRFTPDFVIIALGQNDHNPDPDKIKIPEYRRHWKDKYIEMLTDLMSRYPAAKFVLMLTVLGHDTTWDEALEEITQEINSERVTHFLFRRNGCGTSGHPRATEQEEMAGELYNYITSELM